MSEFHDPAVFNESGRVQPHLFQSEPGPTICKCCGFSKHSRFGGRGPKIHLKTRPARVTA
jgi:hypothetical protein